MQSDTQGKKPVKISALIVNYNSGDYAINCINSLQREVTTPAGQHLELEVIVVDNQSPQDQTAQRQEIIKLGGNWIDQGWNAGYAAGINRAATESTGELLLVVNPDVSFLPGSLPRMVETLNCGGKIGAVGPNTFWDLGCQVQFPPNIVPTLGDAFFQTLAHLFKFWNRRYALNRTRAALQVWQSPGVVDMDLLSGGCILVPRSVWEELGGMDTRYPLYYEDSDWFIAARRRGYRLLQVQDAYIAHFFNRSGVTDEGEAFARYWTSRRRFYRKHYGLPGLWVARATRFLTHGKWTRRFKAGPMDRIVDLGRISTPLTIDLPRCPGKFLLELTQDPGFFMAGAIFGEGQTWTPSEDCWKVFGAAQYYLRAFDISGSQPIYQGTWSFFKVME